MSLIRRLTDNKGGEYVTPGTVADALREHDADLVRLELLRILGKQEGVGAEDWSLCCFVASKDSSDE